MAAEAAHGRDNPVERDHFGDGGPQSAGASGSARGDDDDVHGVGDSAPLAGEVDEDLAAAWQRIVEEVMKRKPMLGGVLMHARPGGIAAGELTVILTGNHFHREALADRANREVVLQAVRRSVPGATGFTVVSEAAGSGSVTEHPAVQAVMAAFQGEVVAVRPRAPEGEGQ